MKLKDRYKFFAVLVFINILIGFTTLYFNYHVLIALMILVSNVLLLVAFKFLSSDNENRLIEMQNTFTQVESMQNLHKIINIDRPLPITRGWALSPDIINVIINNLLDNKPKVIVECGSGISTLIMGYLIKQKGLQSYVYSLEHDEKYAIKSTENLLKHGTNNYAEVVYSQLKQYKLKGKSWKWYDDDELKKVLNNKIDLLIIDGPPSYLQKNARYPALPILKSLLAEKCQIIVDDCNRLEDKRTVELWNEEFPDFTIEWLNTEKGAALLTRN